MDFGADIQGFGIDPIAIARRLAQRQNPQGMPPPQTGAPATPQGAGMFSRPAPVGQTAPAPTGAPQGPGQVADYQREAGSGLALRGRTLAGMPPSAPPSAPPPAAPPIPPAGPMQTRTAADYAAGPPQLHGVGKVFDTIGQILDPTIEARVPGSVGNYWQRLGKEAGATKEEQAARDTDLGAQKTAAQTSDYESQIIQREADARRADAAALKDANQPTQKTRAVVIADADGNPTPALQNMLTGEITGEDGKPITGAKMWEKPAANPAAKPPETKEMTVNGKRMIMGWNPATSKFDIPEGAGVAPEGPQAPHQLVMVPQSDGTTKVVEATPGSVLPKGATTLLEAGKEQTATDAKSAAEQYANDYMASKQFTGPGDEALMEKYFELAKPSSGFRMTQAQIEMLQQARDIMGGLEARAKHAFTPDAPYFSDTQRQQIVQTMKNLAAAGDEARGGGAAGGGADPLEGRTATGPGGAKLVRRGGKWQPQ